MTITTMNLAELGQVTGGTSWSDIGVSAAAGATVGAVTGVISGAVAGATVGGPVGAGIGAIRGDLPVRNGEDRRADAISIDEAAIADRTARITHRHLQPGDLADHR